MSLNKYEESLRLRLQLAQNKEYLDITDVSLLSGYATSTIRARVTEGRLKAHQSKKGAKLLFKKSDVQKWIEGGV
tara:strand:- start:341 stop:565 length:225 start_codon:yes stop_codon:yes gene_type:complete